MHKHTCLFLIFLLNTRPLYAQVRPAEGNTLNYRLIGFSFPAKKKINSCTLEIASGNFTTEDSFRKHIIKTVHCSTNKIISEVPDFGKQYTWHYITGSSNNKTTSTFYHFNTAIFPGTESNTLSRFRILKNGEKYKDAYVFVDATKTLYNMNGQPVWFLPESAESESYGIRDLKITTSGTITYEIDECGGYEVNYNDSVLWKTPNNGIVSGDSTEHYHHQFTRLGNGHYMALAQDFQYFKKASPTDTCLIIMPADKIKPDEIDKVYQKQPMGTLIEYDQKGNVIWSWKASRHFNGSTLFYRKMRFGGIQSPAHENAFFFDEQAKVIYLSCRNLNCIIKIKYPEGNILRIYKGDTNRKSTPAFCGQHSCGISRDGSLYLFNNNVCNAGAPPSVIFMREPGSEKGTLKKVWEYQCKVQNNTTADFASGGNVIELPDRSVFISLGYPDSKLFIVSKDKKILWSAIVEKWDPTKKIWGPTILYRASIITDRAQLERLMWGGEETEQ